MKSASHVLLRSVCAYTLGLAVLLIANSAIAGSITYYGPYSDLGNGGSTIYKDVVESSSGTPPALFGEPDAVVDQLDFDPAENVFQALALDGAIDFVDSALSFKAHTVPTEGITSLLIEEILDYSFALGGTSTTRVSGAIGGVIVKVLEVNGSAVSPITITPGPAVVTRNAADDPASGTIINGLLVDIGAYLPGAGSVATKIEVSLDDTLAAASEPGTVAFIRKKDFTITPGIEPNPVPEPTSLALVALGLVGMMAGRRS